MSLSHQRAVLAGGLPALQLESGDDPHLDGAEAGGTQVNHQTPPGLEPKGPGSGLPAPGTPDPPLPSVP